MTSLLGGVVVVVLMGTLMPSVAKYMGMSSATVEEGGSPLMNRVFQEKTLADMRAFSTANETFRGKKSRYAKSVDELIESGLIDKLSTSDAWGNPWIYTGTSKSYRLTSLGSDQAAGPEPPDHWDKGVYAPDIVLDSGQFVQAPSTRS